MGKGDKLWSQWGGLSFTTYCPSDSKRISVPVLQAYGWKQAGSNASLSGCCGD